MLHREEPLASAPTLCRSENRASRAAAWALHAELVNTFIASFKSAPEELTLDFDATDDPVHGKQQGRFFHGYYDSHCFLPLYVFCGERLLVSYLQSSKIDAVKHAWAVLALLVKRLRQAWHAVRIVLRADSGFCRPRMHASTLRTKLLKIGAVIARNTRRVRVMPSSAYPYQDVFTQASIALRSP